MPLAAKIGGGFAIVLVMVFGALYVRLLQGPIPLSFLVRPIETAIAGELATVRVRIDDAAVRLGDGGQLQFELKNVRISDAADQPLAVAPTASVGLSRRALLRGRIAPESVDLIEPRLVMFYTEEGRLSLTFSPPGEAADRPRTPPQPALRGTVDSKQPAGEADDWTLGRIDLVKMLSAASASARRRENATAFLREVGLRSATVTIDTGSRKSIWRVPELDIDLDHRRSRSQIAGRARIQSITGPWDLHFRTYEHESSKSLQLALSVHGLVPRGLARTLPQLAALESFDVPVWGEAKLELSNAGDILGGSIAVDAAPGRVILPWMATTPFSIDGGHLALSYSSATRRFEIAPSVLVWGDSRVQFTGSITHTAQGGEGPGWVFDVKSAGGWFAAEPPAIDRLQIEDWAARGFLAPERGRVVLSQFFLRAGGADVAMQGDVADMGGAMKARLDGKIGPMPAAVFKTLWPAALAPATRGWVSRHLTRGDLQGGSFKIISGRGAASADWKPDGSADRVSLALEGQNVAFNLLDGWPALEIPRALLRVEGQSLEVAAPEANFATPDGRRLALKGSFTVDLNEPLPRHGTITAHGQGPLSLALDMLDQEPWRILHNAGLQLTGSDGKVDGKVAISMPLGRKLEARDLKIEGKVRVLDGRARQMFGLYDVTGGNILFDMTGTAVEARAEMLIKGVVAKASWQHVYGAAPEKQPPLVISTVLDAADRNRLGIDVNEMVLGEVGVEVAVSRDARGERHTHVRTDLTKAEIVLEAVAWRKPRGRPSGFEFDVIKGGTHPLELHNVRLEGENIAVEGWMGIGADHQLREFRFPTFSLNVVTSLTAHGKLRSDNVWEVKASGPRFDGTSLFQSFFDIGQMSSERAAPSKDRAGLDLTAEIGLVMGFNENSLRNVAVTLRKRNNRLVAADARGVLGASGPRGAQAAAQEAKMFTAVLREEAGPRRLRAEAQDAGQFLKLVGFYPDAIGGTMNLEVNLDGQGAAARTGTMTIKQFTALGPPTVIEGGGPPNADGVSTGKRRTVRERMEFFLLTAPFSVGHGQFVIHDASIEGPLVSAFLRGKVDFRSRTIAMDGTFTPLSGINRMFSPVPVVGPIVTGTRGEGMFAVNYIIQGRLDDPQLIINPLSAFAPGVVRDIIQITPEAPRVVPRDRGSGRSDPARSSSSPASGPGASR